MSPTLSKDIVDTTLYSPPFDILNPVERLLFEKKNNEHNKCVAFMETYNVIKKNLVSSQTKKILKNTFKDIFIDNKSYDLVSIYLSRLFELSYRGLKKYGLVVNFDAIKT